MKQENKFTNFDIVFEKLEEAKVEQINCSDFSDSDYLEIKESIETLQEIQQSIDVSSYTYFTST